jgi:multidrug efflux system outer membrane protein
LALISTGDRYAVASRGRIDFRETNDALTGSQKRQDKLTQQFERVAALRELARLANRRFDLGASGYLDMLVAENELFAAELATVSLQGSRYAQVINVYQALGGGWVDKARSLAPQPLGRVAAKP